MKKACLDRSRLDQLVGRFEQCRIAVLGDFFLDKYFEVDRNLEELSVETGKLAHQVVEVRCSPGAAGTVVNNLAALGTGQLQAIGILGQDGEGFDLEKALQRIGCQTEHLLTQADRMTPTYLKPRDLGIKSLSAEHSRYDTKNHSPTQSPISQRIVEALDKVLPEVDAVIVMDQVEEEDCGVVTHLVREAVADRAAKNPQTVFFADSRRFIRRFRNTIIKPNQFEAVGMEKPTPDAKSELIDVIRSAQVMRGKNGGPVVVTRGSDGMLVSDPEWTEISGVPVTGEIDPTGAGDSVTAGIVLTLCAGATLAEAAVVGNLVASITVEQIATTGVAKPGELPARLDLWHEHRGA